MTYTTIKPERDMPDIFEDVRTGLLSQPRSLPPKYLYDERGSLLFEEICTTPEYYPTRTEKKLLSSYGKEIISQVLPSEIMELGSGNSKKTRLLFDACEQNEHTCFYSPIDVCAPMLESVSAQLQADYNWLNVSPLLCDYHAGLKYLPKSKGARLFVFLGGTIGNLYPQQAKDFINEIKVIMQPNDYLLIGADRIKDNDILHAAYNDQQGITEKFNLNLLNVLNRELKADFDLSNFEHQAIFNQEFNRMEMRVICTRDHTVYLQHLDERISFHKNDSILTEVSHKFTVDGLEELLGISGLNIHKHYESDNKYFSLVLMNCS